MTKPALFGAMFSTVLAAVAIMAQAPDNVKVDTEQARAMVVTEQPHHPSAMHEHPTNRIQIYLGAGEMTFTSPAGKVEKIAFNAGDVRSSAAGVRHIGENVTDHPFQLVEIELKNHPRPFTPSDLDPLKTDPKHYTLEFENDQIPCPAGPLRAPRKKRPPLPQVEPHRRLPDRPRQRSRGHGQDRGAGGSQRGKPARPPGGEDRDRFEMTS
jgi:quercetin dioxygenase-like cupin family protein